MSPYRIAADADPGLQPQRTALSWTRTALVIAVNALLALRSGLIHGEPWLVGVGVALFAAGAAVVAIGTVRRRQLSGDTLDITPPPGAIAGVAAATVLAAMAGVASILVATAS
ncbi:DUF202 domain-containing protein [Agromyces sp. CFH 90414]|uniref:DUF202 domain-containing protein n=1 Tax=Agromyces agglutinans TaxID=2662258 RepID=A0A6I2F9G9_9MICO|nr:DUF202 domain-containing protein [Agromyces agglutinans]MRG60884.1 DUF202 domain-containing protein [Agromyces agglutinans]